MTILHSVVYKHWTQVPRCYKIPIWCNFYLHQRLLSQNTEPNPMANFALLSSDKRESCSLPPTHSSRERVYCFETVSLLGRFRLSVSSQGREKILLPFPTFTLSPTQWGGSTQLSRPTVTNVILHKGGQPLCWVMETQRWVGPRPHPGALRHVGETDRNTDWANKGLSCGGKVKMTDRRKLPRSLVVRP